MPPDKIKYKVNELLKVITFSKRLANALGLYLYSSKYSKKKYTCRQLFAFSIVRQYLLQMGQRPSSRDIEDIFKKHPRLLRALKLETCPSYSTISRLDQDPFWYMEDEFHEALTSTSRKARKQFILDLKRQLKLNKD